METQKTLSQNEQKVLAAYTAVDTLVEKGILKSGMKVGLGTGSTAMPAVDRVAYHIQNGNLKDIKAVVTSFQTENRCLDLDIPVYSMNDRRIGGVLDVAIDGADEIDPDCNLIKGGGAAHVREKIVEYNSKVLVIVADQSKVVPHIGTGFKVPVEIIPDSRQAVTNQLEALGAKCYLREGVKKAGPVVTDNGNQILDCQWEKPIADLASMEVKINQIVGVVENGLFAGKNPIAFIAKENGSVEVRNLK